MQDLHAIAVAASDGLAALNLFIETRFAMADALADDEPEAAAEMRKVWTNVWETLADAPARALHAELHDDALTPADVVLTLAPVA